MFSTVLHRPECFCLLEIVDCWTTPLRQLFLMNKIVPSGFETRHLRSQSVIKDGIGFLKDGTVALGEGRLCLCLRRHWREACRTQKRIFCSIRNNWLLNHSVSADCLYRTSMAVAHNFQSRYCSRELSRFVNASTVYCMCRFHREWRYPHLNDQRQPRLTSCFP